MKHLNKLFFQYLISLLKESNQHYEILNLENKKLNSAERITKNLLH